MPSLMGRLKRAVQALRDNPPPDIAASTVREWETNETYGKRQQYKAADLCAMFLGVVKVAASRTAQGIAGNRLCVMRMTRGGMKSAWDMRPVSRKSVQAIKRRAGVVAQKYASMGDEMMEVVDPLHPYVKLLDTINCYHNPFEMMEATQLVLSLTGDAYWKIVEANGVPVELWPLHPAYVHVVPDRQRIIGGYIYGRGTENERRYEPEEVIHFRNVNPRGDPYHGFGDLEACVAEARLGIEFVAIAQAMIDNGMQPGLVVQDQMTDAQQKQLERSLTKKNAGAHNAGRHLVLSLSEKGKVTQLNWGEKEIAFLQSSERVDQVVANSFDMPIEFLRMKPGGLSGNSDSMHWWQTYGLQPRGRKIEDQLNARLSPMFGEDVFVCFGPWVQEDEEKAANAAVAGYNAGILKLNEARKRFGEDPEEGEEGETYKAAPEPLLGFGGGPAKEMPEKEMEDEPKKAAPLRLTGAVAMSAAAMLFVPGHAHCCQRPPVAAMKDLGGETIRLTERQLETALRVWFDRQAPRVVSAVNETGIGWTLSGNAEAEQTLAAAVRRFMEGLFRAGLAAGAADVASRLDAAKLNEALTAGARGYLDDYLGKLIQSVTATVDERIRTTLSEGIGAGDTITELRDRVQEAMGNASRYGAERIARTETSRAYLTARETAWSESGVVAKKEWLLSADPCPVCQTIAEEYNQAGIGDAFVQAGAAISLIGGGEFTASYGAIMTPPAHPNCMCSLGAVFKP